MATKRQILQKNNGRKVLVISKNWMSKSDLKRAILRDMKKQNINPKYLKDQGDSFSVGTSYVSVDKRKPKYIATMKVHSTYLMIDGLRFYIKDIQKINSNGFETKLSKVQFK